MISDLESESRIRCEELVLFEGSMGEAGTAGSISIHRLADQELSFTPNDLPAAWQQKAWEVAIALKGEG